MARFPYLACRLLATLSFLSIGKSLDSINLDLEILDQIPLDDLGTPNLDRYQAEWDVTVDDTCQYMMRVSFFMPDDEVAGAAEGEFNGVCEPNTNTGNAPDGLPWHAHRRHWASFPQYVFDTTGFNHMSMMWRPCGLPPKGFRKPRMELNFYNVIPQYRVFMRCQEFKTPSVCQYNQSSWLGRGHFSLPRLERDPNFLANMPVGFQPDSNEPEAYQFEGMIAYDNELVPDTPSQWILPTFLMSTYDGDTISWRGLLPNNFISGGNSTRFSQTQFYVFQTQLRLPAGWNMTYHAPTGNITVLLYGSAGLCGEGFEMAKNPNGTSTEGEDVDGEGGDVDGAVDGDGTSTAAPDGELDGEGSGVSSEGERLLRGYS